jgi:hypothetical protein
MIEQPIDCRTLWTSKENWLELLRRIRQHFHREPNPLNKLTVTGEQYKNYFKFAFVRNPWARAFSWYKNVMRDQVHRKGYRVREGIPLNEFLRRYAGRGMLRPQTYWINSFDGSIPLDYIGRFESLGTDFAEICRCLQIVPPALPHTVKGTGDDYCEHTTGNQSIWFRESTKGI